MGARPTRDGHAPGTRQGPKRACAGNRDGVTGATLGISIDTRQSRCSKALLRDPEITMAEVARRLGVVPSTLYRHLPRARTAALEAQG